jgi:hypothetical protein
VRQLAQPIDYTNLGYESLREAMLDLARESLPEWTDFSENDIGVLLLELFAYASDVTLYYQTRIASNLFPATSDEPEAMIQLLRLIGYELRPPSPATVNLDLAFSATPPPAFPYTIASGSKFFVTLLQGEQLVFETEREYLIQSAQLSTPDARNLRHVNFLISAVEGETVSDAPLAFSDGSPNQIYSLRKKPVIAGSVRVTVEESGGTVSWKEVDTLAASSPADRHFLVQRDATGTATIIFGDGNNGMLVPRGTPVSPVKINATYRIGGGSRGNVPAGAKFIPADTNIREATNPQAAAGGAEREDLDNARSFAPRLFRTQERAVTTNDYVDLALQVPGVGKARAVALNWNQIYLYAAPSGQVAEPSELLKRDLLSFFESRRMASTTLKIVGPEPADIYLGAVIRANPYFLKADVKEAVERAVSEYLAFEAVDFGQPIYLSKVYDVIQSLEQVASLTVTKFSRNPEPMPVTSSVQDIESDGIIELGPNELPRPGYRDGSPVRQADGSTLKTPIFLIIEGGVGQ